MSWDQKTWQTLERRWEQGFERLWPEEQQVIALWWLVSDTMNGTLDQFFWNSSGDLALFAQAGLRRLNLPVTATALDSALAHFGPIYLVDRDERHGALNRLIARLGEQQFNQLFNDETRVIQDHSERCGEVALNDLRARYLKAGID